MVLRTARQGKNAGGKFYGCSKWRSDGKGCNGTLPVETEDNNSDNDQNHTQKKFSSSTSTLAFPIKLIAKEKVSGFQSRFIESVAVPYRLLRKIRTESLPDDTLMQYSQWRLDYPFKAPVVDEKIRQILSVAQKILTRGEITLTSPTLEKLLSNHFKCDLENGLIGPAEKYLAATEGSASFSEELLKDWLESDEERYFFSKIIPKLIGRGWFKWVHPQVDISSLISGNTEIQLSGRVDFLLCCPSQPSIVIEIDGEQHGQHKKADAQRDSLLEGAGYRVLRFSTKQLNEGPIGSTFQTLIDSIKMLPAQVIPINDSEKTVQAFKIIHQIQIAILQAIETGFLDPLKSSNWTLDSDLDKKGLFSESDCNFLIEAAITDLLDVLRSLGRLYEINICDGSPVIGISSNRSASVFLSFNNSVKGTTPTFLIQNIFFPRHIANELGPVKAAKLGSPLREDIEFFLNYIFRKESLREGQFDAISRTLGGNDSIVLLPTGAGKSMVFQLSGLLLPGRSVVIEPLISLMDDQIDNLQNIGIDRCVAITSQIANVNVRGQVIKLFGQGEYLYSYVAPERFQTKSFRESLRTLTTHTPISIIAIDEAHCVSEWGHDFRTSYLNIGKTSREYCQSRGVSPPLLALTGTASRGVLKDLQRELEINDFEAIITPKTFDRTELNYEIVNSQSSEKRGVLLGYLGKVLPEKFYLNPSTFFQTREEGTYSGLIFCPHVNGDFGVVKQAEEIRKSLRISATCYSGAEPKTASVSIWGETKRETARQFKNNDIPLLVATKAFGMGIDKANVRYTIHFGLPNSIESFYQEAGRAGRDRKPAHCCILVSIDDQKRADRLLSPNTSAKSVQQEINNIGWEDADDITRTLFFQTKAFPGIDEEVEKTKDVLNNIANISSQSNQSLVTDKNHNRSDTEKGLHRLLILGVIKDYTVNYANDEFELTTTGASKLDIIESYERYVKGYSQDRAIHEKLKAGQYLDFEYRIFICNVIGLLVGFIYDVIEKGRRRALYEMMRIATDYKSDGEIRKRILDYLETTQYSEDLEKIVNNEQAGLLQAKSTFAKMRSPNDASELRGQVSRYLESYPDHPGLMFLRALSEIKAKDGNRDVTIENFISAVSSAIDGYGIDKSLLFEVIVWGIKQIHTTNDEISDALTEEMLTRFQEPAFYRYLVRELELSKAVKPAWLLVHYHAIRSMEILNLRGDNGKPRREIFES
jgi:ATP-dependent DNA helicase RecQ